MPSPVGHALIGLTIANLQLGDRLYKSIFWLGFVVFAAIVPDLDFLPGWIEGDINLYHHGISHSIGAAMLFAVICALIAKYFEGPVWQILFVSLLVFLSHLLGDYLGVDRFEPYGAPFLWPFSSEYYLSPVQVFHPIEHGNPGDSNASVFSEIFSTVNIVAATIEIVIVIPFWLMTLWASRRQISKKCN